MHAPDPWEYAPFDAVTWAMKGRNRRAARALLEKRGGLTWVEGSEYAPWTLGWAPDLLALILDLVPQDGEELFCQRRLLLPGGKWMTHICAGLLTAAAALDDLEAVELLLECGYQLDEHELYRCTCLSPHYCELGQIRSNTRFTLLNHIALLSLEDDETIPLFLDHAGPLSAAIFCGSVDCTLRLLEETDGELSLSARHALIHANRLGLPTASAVAGRLGQELADLLEPEEFLDRKDPLFYQCLARHGAEEQHRFLIQYLLSSGEKSENSQAALYYINPTALSTALLDLIGQPHQTRRASPRELRYLLQLPGLSLVLDRNAVPPEADRDFLLALLDRAPVVGEPPRGELSGLAAVLLKRMLLDGHLQAVSLLRREKLRTLLAQEDPRVIPAYLRHVQAQFSHLIPPQSVHLLLSLLNIQEEVSYVL